MICHASALAVSGYIQRCLVFCLSCPRCVITFSQFELRYDEVDRARAVFERYVEILPTVKAWVRCGTGG